MQVGRLKNASISATATSFLLSLVVSGCATTGGTTAAKKGTTAAPPTATQQYEELHAPSDAGDRSSSGTHYVSHEVQLPPEEGDEVRSAPERLPVPDNDGLGASEFWLPAEDEPLIVASPEICAAVRSPRANTSPDAQCWMSDYYSRLDTSLMRRDWSDEESLNLPPSYVPWWDALVRQPLNPASHPQQFGIALLSESALQYSSYVRIITAAPSIRQTELVQREADFDWNTFLKSTYNDVNEPVGNTLTTGTNAERFLDRRWSLDAGGRRRNTRGGQVELYQRFGFRDNNSVILDPNPQRTTRLELQYTQPLLRGAGRAYNESQIVLAEIRLDQSSDEVAELLEAHLIDVTPGLLGTLTLARRVSPAAEVAGGGGERFIPS